MTVIQDGTGRGFTMAVNAANEGVVKAISATIEHLISSRDSQAYYANTTDTADTLTLATGNTYNMLYLENLSGTKDLVIEKITLSVDTANVVAILKRNMTLGTAGANNVHTPRNSNFSSGNIANTLCHNWDETGTAGVTGLTGGSTMTTHILPAGEFIDPVDGFIILQQGNSLTVQLTNGTGGNVEAEVGVRFYFDRTEI